MIILRCTRATTHVHHRKPQYEPKLQTLFHKPLDANVCLRSPFTTTPQFPSNLMSSHSRLQRSITTFPAKTIERPRKAPRYDFPPNCGFFKFTRSANNASMSSALFSGSFLDGRGCPRMVRGPSPRESLWVWAARSTG